MTRSFPCIVFLALLFLHGLPIKVRAGQAAGQEPPAAAHGAVPPAVEQARANARKKAAEAGRLVGQGDWQKGQELANAALADDPESVEARYVLALAYEAGGKFEAAEIEYKKMGAFAPEPLLELSLARLYLRQGRIAEAEQQARRAVEKNRWVPQPHLSLGAVAMRKADYTAAIESFSTAVDVEPRDWHARLSLADAYRHATRWDDALVQYTRALSLNPNLWEALLGRAQTWEQMGRAPEAIAAYEKALEANPALVLAQHNLARLYLVVDDNTLRKPERAIELARAAAEATRWRNREILETLAQAYMVGAQEEKSREVRQKMKELPE